MYEKYGLFDMPFKFGEHDHEIVGASQKETFAKILQLFSYSAAHGSRTGNRFIAVLRGEYGYGKSFFHTKLTESIVKRDANFRKQIEGDVKIAVSFFPILPPDKKLPSKLMVHLYNRIVTNLGNNGQRAFFDLYVTLKDKADACGKKTKDLLKDLDGNFQKAILKLDNSCPEQFIAWKWISAQKLNRRELDSLGIQYCIDTSEVAEKYIFQLLKLLKILEYGLLVVLIDELEEVLTIINEKTFWRSLIVIKEISDQYGGIKYSDLNPVAPIGFLGGLTNAAWDSVERGSEEEGGIQAVRSRIHDDNVFAFEKFNIEDTREFMKVLLSKKRIKGYKGDDLFPFEKDTVEIIAEYTDGNPREVMKKCQELLESAHRKKLNKINVELVTRYFQGIGGGGITEKVFNKEGEKDILEDEEKI